MERLRTRGGDDPLARSICSCQGVANKHEIYVHFERSPFTIGFLSGAVARERRAGQAQAREKPGLLVAVTRERGARHPRGDTHAHAPSRTVLAPRSLSGSGRPACRSGRSSGAWLAVRP